MDTEDTPKQSEEAAPVELKVRLKGLEDVDPEFVNIVQMTHDPYGIRLVLAQFLAPLLFSEEDRLDFLRQGPVAKVVGNFVLSPVALRDFTKVMNEQLAKYERQFGPITD